MKNSEQMPGKNTNQLLLNKVAVVSGAGSGIGQEISLQLASAGWAIFLIGRSREKLEFTKHLIQKELSASSQVVPLGFWHGSLGQLTDELKEDLKLSLRSFIQNSIKKERPLNIALINNAGSVVRKSSAESKTLDWQKMLNDNLLSAVELTEITLPFLENADAAQIINISSNLGLHPIAGVAAYSAAKAALCNWTQTLALELSNKPIPTNCICPGIVDTPIHEFFGKPGHQETVTTLAEIHPSKRIGTPRDVGSFVSFLCNQDHWSC